jgi:hypothetical protein
MLALANHPESSFFECADGLEVGNARKARHGLDGNLDLTDFRTLREIGHRREMDR